MKPSSNQPLRARVCALLAASICAVGCGAEVQVSISEAVDRAEDEPRAEVAAAGESRAEPTGTSTGLSPELVFARTTHSFGKVPDGEELFCEFAFKNEGRQPLTIIAMEASCGCTAAELEQKVFAPGEGDVIGVHWTPKGFGTQEQTVKVVSAGERESLLTLRVQADVQPLFKFEPTRADFGYVPKGTRQSKLVRILSERSDLALLSVGNSSPHMRGLVLPDEAAEAAGAHSLLEVSLEPSAPKGRILASLRLGFGPRGGSPEMYRDLVLSAFNYESVYPDKQMFAVGLVLPGQTVNYPLELVAEENLRFRVLSAEVRGAPFPMQVEVAGNGMPASSAQLVLRGDPGDFEGLLRARVWITTDAPETEPLILDVMGRVGAPK